MPKKYTIASTGRTPSGTIRNVKTTGGATKTVKQVNQDIENGFTVITKAGCHRKSAPVTTFGTKHITTRPDSKKCNNLLELPVHE